MTRDTTRAEFLRAYRAHLDRIEPDWRAALARQAARINPDWRVFETVIELPDGSEEVVALLCRGGMEGERIDDDPGPPPAGDLRLAA